MTRKGPRTVDLVARIGLKAPAMNNRKDIYDLLPCVSELYQVDIVDLCKKYAREDKNYIVQAVEMKDDADRLLDKYGPRIWTREKRRPWLFIAGKHELFGGHKEYGKDLYFDDPDHHEILKRTLREIVQARALRYQKDHPREHSVRCSSDASRSSTPAVPHLDQSSRATTTTFTDNILCEHMGGNGGQSLRAWGIWLGDYSDHTRRVNGPSVTGVNRLRDGSRAGMIDWRGPDTMKASRHKVRHLQCDQCRNSRALTILCMDLFDGMVWTLPFNLDQRKVFAIVKKTPKVPGKWIFWSTRDSYLMSQTVPMLEAIQAKTTEQRNEASRDLNQGGSRPTIAECLSSSTSKRPIEPPLQAEGSAKRLKTNDITRSEDRSKFNDGMSVAAVEPQASVPINKSGDAPSVRQSELSGPAASGKSNGKKPVREVPDATPIQEDLYGVTPGRELSRAGPLSREGSSKGVAHVDRDVEDAFAKAAYEVAQQEQGAQDHDVPVDKTSRSDEAPAVSAVAEKADFLHPSRCAVQPEAHPAAVAEDLAGAKVVPTKALALSEDKQLTSTTAALVSEDSAAHSNTNEVATVEHPLAVQVADPAPTPAGQLVLMTSPERKMRSPSYSLCFRLWLKVDWNPNRSVVFLDNSMNIDSVYDRITSVLNRKLEGKEMVCLTVVWPEQEPFDVEPGNADAWEVLLEMVKEAGLTAVTGTVLRKE